MNIKVNVVGYAAKAEYITRQIASILKTRKLDAPMVRAGLQHFNGNVYLLIKLDSAKMKSIGRYSSPDLVLQIRSTIGVPVVPLPINGFWFVILIKQIKKSHKLPASTDFPGWKKNVLQLGTDPNNVSVEMPWSKVVHIMIGGMTGSGKTNLQRLIINQAIQEKFELIILDPKRTGFSYLNDHPQLVMKEIAHNNHECRQHLSGLLFALRLRYDRFSELPGPAPETLEAFNAAVNEKLPHILLVIDEINTLIKSHGGPNSDFANCLNEIITTGRQFGIHVIASGQIFHRQIIGFIRDQFALRICFQVAERSTSTTILGTGAAVNLRQPGMAASNRFPNFQVHLMRDADLIPKDDEIGLTPDELEMAKKLIDDHGGKFTFAALKDVAGLGQPRATKLRNAWHERGLVEQRADLNNAWMITTATIERIENRLNPVLIDV